MGRTTRMRALPYLIALAPYLWLVRQFNFLTDDAYISFRYASNLVNGLGLRFNPGVEPPVEGYSNFLWVIWISLFERFGVDPGVAARASSIACGVALVTLTVRYLERRMPDSPLRLSLASLFLGTVPPLAVWSTGGLATIPFALCAFGTYERLFAERPRWVQAGCFAVPAVLLRAEGIEWIAVLCVAAALSARLHGAAPGLARAALRTLAVAALVAAVHTLWRHGYYGEWVPNTARAKVALSPITLERGAKYLAANALTFPSLALIFCAAPFFLRRKTAPALLVAWCAAGATAGYAVIAGGDFMAMGRFLVPAVPFLAILLGGFLARVSFPVAATSGAVLVVLGILPAFDRHVVPEGVRARFHFRWNASRYLSEYGQWSMMEHRRQRWTCLGWALAEHTAPDASLCSTVIGATGYYSRRVIYDQYGLTEPAVLDAVPEPKRRSAGHDRGVPAEFFLDREPTYLSAEIVSTAARMQSFPQRWQTPEWEELLEIEWIPVADCQGCRPDALLRLVRYASR